MTGYLVLRQSMTYTSLNVTGKADMVAENKVKL